MELITRASNDNSIGTEAECDYCGAFTRIVATHNDNDICECCSSGVKKSSAKKRFNANDDTKAHRALAAMFGGKALTGTAKQKVWGEVIRAQAIANATSGDDDIKQVISSDFTKSAKFWIENRKITERADFFSFVLADVVKLIGAINDNYPRAFKTRLVHDRKEAARAFFKAWGDSSVIYPTYSNYIEFFSEYKK